MRETTSTFDKIKLFIRIYIPMFITQICLIGGNFVAVFMTGQYGTDDLAGMSIGFNIWITGYTALLGILYGITPLISNMLGAKDYRDLKGLIQNGFYMASLFSTIAIILGFIFIPPLTSMLDLNTHARYVTLHYMLGIAFAVFPLLWVSMMRNIVDSHGYTHYSMAIIVTGFIVNSTLNYLLIFGKFGFPELGGVGAGFATAITVWLNASLYFFILKTKKPFRDYQLFNNWSILDLTYWKAQLSIGLPMGVAIFCEMSIFSLAAFAMAYYGTDYIAAQQAALSFTNLFYCVPLTIGLTSTIMIAYELGAKRYADVIKYANIARLFAIFLAIFIASGGFHFLNEIAYLYTNDENMISLISHFLSYAMLFSVIDAFGTPVQGILRGYKDMKIVTMIAISTYWGVSFPVAALFSIGFNQGPYGIWVGLLSGIAAAGVLYILRLRYQEKKLKLLIKQQLQA